MGTTRCVLYNTSMLPVLKSSSVRRLLPSRRKNSHKGENGRVLIIGGSLEYYGAPVLAGLGALHSGCDLVTLVVPECNFEVTRSLYPDFIVRKFSAKTDERDEGGNFLTGESASMISEMTRECHALLIGPGLGERKETIEAVMRILQSVKIPCVLDASAMYALKKIPVFPLSQPIIVTPHLNEFQKLIDRDFFSRDSEQVRQKKMLYLQTVSKDLHINIVLKGPEDFVTSDQGETVLNTTGNAGMTVGGSGDVLAGFIVSLIAQGAAPYCACQAAAHIFGLVGEDLFRQKGYGYCASDLAFHIPFVLKKFQT